MREIIIIRWWCFVCVRWYRGVYRGWSERRLLLLGGGGFVCVRWYRGYIGDGVREIIIIRWWWFCVCEMV